MVGSGFFSRIGRGLVWAERVLVGGGMRLIALFAERRFRHSLEERPTKRRKRGMHFDLKDR